MHMYKYIQTHTRNLFSVNSQICSYLRHEATVPAGGPILQAVL